MANIEKPAPLGGQHVDFSHFTVGPVAVDSLKNSLTNNLNHQGTEQLIEPRLMRLLIVLARHAGTPVHRDDLLLEISDTAYPSDEALTQAISKLRRALGDKSKSPQFIKTVPKRGYMLIAPVEIQHVVSENTDTPQPIPSQTETNDPQTPKDPVKPIPVFSIHMPTVWAITALLALLIAGYLFFTKDDVQFIEKGDIEFIEKTEK